MAVQLEISESVAGDVTVLKLTGRLVADEEDIFFARHVDRLVAAGRVQIVVDFRDVTTIDSGGVGTLVAKLLSVRRRGGDIRLLQVTNRTRRVLEITRLLSVFTIFEWREEAIGSFAADVARIPAAAVL
jgi:anti-sigma B factor antagonist